MGYRTLQHPPCGHSCAGPRVCEDTPPERAHFLCTVPRPAGWAQILGQNETTTKPLARHCIHCYKYKNPNSKNHLCLSGFSWDINNFWMFMKHAYQFVIDFVYMWACVCVCVYTAAPIFKKALCLLRKEQLTASVIHSRYPSFNTSSLHTLNQSFMTASFILIKFSHTWDV